MPRPLQELLATEVFVRLFEAVPMGLLIVDSNGTMVLANKRFAQTFGYTRQELNATPVSILIPERFRATHEQFREVYQNEPMARTMGSGRVLIGCRKDGTEFRVEIGLSPLVLDGRRLVLAALIACAGSPNAVLSPATAEPAENACFVLSQR